MVDSCCKLDVAWNVFIIKEIKGNSKSIWLFYLNITEFTMIVEGTSLLFLQNFKWSSWKIQNSNYYVFL